MSKRRIGFFPVAFNLAETTRMVNIAAALRDLGEYEPVLFSHGGQYESLITEHGLTLVPVEPTFTQKDIDHFWRLDTMETIWGDIFSYHFLKDQVVHEIEAFKKTGIGMVVTGFNLPCDISARAVQAPLVWVIPATGGRLYLDTGRASFPDALERPALRMAPQAWKDRFYTWFMRGSKTWLKPFTRVAKDLGIEPVAAAMLDLWEGDHTLYSDLLDFIDLPASVNAPKENFVGPLLGQLEMDLEPEIEAHLTRSDRSIYFAMGSSGNKELFLRVLKALSQTNFLVVAAYTTILDKSEVPRVSPNIILRKLVPAERVSRLAGLSIIHGGQGTVYTAAYSGRPAIGIPMQFEQQYNLDCLVHHGCGIRLSKSLFREKDLLAAIDQIFDHYDVYHEKAQALAARLNAQPKANGALTAARRIAELLSSYGA